MREALFRWFSLAFVGGFVYNRGKSVLRRVFSFVSDTIFFLVRLVLSLPQFVCISHQRWDEDAQRIRHLFQGLPGLSMLFFEPAQPLFSKLRRPVEGTCVAEGVTAYTLPCSVPANEYGRLRITQRSRKNAAFVQRLLIEHKYENPVLWLRCPDQVELMFELHLSHVVYDCDRDWQALPPEWEEVLVREAGLVLSAAPSLHERMQLLHDNAVLLPNGADLSLFSHAGERFRTLPADLKELSDRGWVLGFLGSVEDFTQLGPVCHAAQAHPEWSFVFVGPVAPNNPGLRRCRQLNNIHFLGEKAPVSLERYLSGFDVCFSLLDDRFPDPPVFPQQLYQYLAAGKPIAAMSGGQLERSFPDVISYPHNEEEFLFCCQRALGERYLQTAPQRKKYASESLWSLRRDRLHQLLRTNGLA